MKVCWRYVLLFLAAFFQLCHNNWWLLFPFPIDGDSERRGAEDQSGADEDREDIVEPCTRRSNVHRHVHIDTKAEGHSNVYIVKEVDQAAPLSGLSLLLSKSRNSAVFTAHFGDQQVDCLAEDYQDDVQDYRVRVLNQELRAEANLFSFIAERLVFLFLELEDFCLNEVCRNHIERGKFEEHVEELNNVGRILQLHDQHERDQLKTAYCRHELAHGEREEVRENEGRHETTLARSCHKGANIVEELLRLPVHHLW